MRNCETVFLLRVLRTVGSMVGSLEAEGKCRCVTPFVEEEVTAEHRQLPATIAAKVWFMKIV